jgi:hypothetical protein
MNERIKELFNQAVDHTAAMDNGKLSQLALNNICAERLAELIIRECRDIISANRDLAIEDGWNVDEAMSTAMCDIEEHFGIGQ